MTVIVGFGLVEVAFQPLKDPTRAKDRETAWTFCNAGSCPLVNWARVNIRRMRVSILVK
jgi:hypothetical protein